MKYGEVEFPCDTGAPEGQPDAPRLVVRDHDGGEVEWWSADGGGEWSRPIPEDLKQNALEIRPMAAPVIPSRASLLVDAAESRECARSDIGGFALNRSHFASLLLLDSLLAHSDDWFTLPLEAQIGDVVTIDDLVVVDLFEEAFSFATDPPAKTTRRLVTVQGAQP